MAAIISFIGGVGMQEMLLIGIFVLIFFGAKKIPEFMQGLGKGVRGFRQGLHDVKEDLEKSKEEDDVKKKTPESL